jgi:hypothetical protein
MKLFKRHRNDEPGETPCPRCGVPVALDAAECAVCGWDPHDAFDHAVTDSGRSLPGTADDKLRMGAEMGHEVRGRGG